jgi:hypothetical protein
MDLATVDHLLTTTRSVRKRLDLARAVDPRIIQQCIDIAVQAPNGGNGGAVPFRRGHRSSEAGADRRAVRLYEKEVAALLGIPADVTQAVLLPVAYFTGDDFKPATRVPGCACTYWDTWGRTRGAP